MNTETAAAEKTPTLPPFLVDENEPIVHSTTTDDRRNKRYNRTVTIGVRLYARDWSARNDLQNYMDSIKPRVVAAGKDLQVRLVPKGAAVTTGYDYGSFNSWGRPYGKAEAAGWEYGMGFAFTVRFAASRPSLVPHETTCLHAIDVAGTAGLLAQAIRDGIKDGEDKAARERRTRIANALLGAYTSLADERAQAAIDYEARCAALASEYAEALQVEADKLLVELGDDAGVKFSDDPDYVPSAGVVRTAKRHLKSRLEKLRAPHQRGFHHRAEDAFITSDDEDLR